MAPIRVRAQIDCTADARERLRRQAEHLHRFDAGVRERAMGAELAITVEAPDPFEAVRRVSASLGPLMAEAGAVQAVWAEPV